MAAMLGKSKVLGVIGPIVVGDAKLYVDGFCAGAKSGGSTDSISASRESAPA
jgi:hypothetical protein